MSRNYEMKNFDLPIDKNQNAQYIPITVLIGLVGILLITIYNSAFKNGRFTCNKYILNTYLYILLAILIIILEVLLFEYNDIRVVDIYGNLTGWLPIILTFIVIIGLLIATMMIDPKNVLLKHIVYFTFILSTGLLVYPSYTIAKNNNVILQVLFSLVGILVFFSAVAFVKPEWISLSWGPVLLFLLIGAIIALIVSYIVGRKNKRNRVPKPLSYFIIGLFILFVLYDTKLIQVHAKTCTTKTADYVNESLGIFIDALNLFQQLVNVNT